MEKQKTKFRKAVETAGALAGIFLVATGLIWAAKRQVESTHTTKYKSAVAVRYVEGAMLHSPCVPVEATVKANKDTVILALPTDSLSGKPVIVAEKGIVIVEQADGSRFGIAYAYTPGLPETPGNKLFILVEAEMIIIMSQRAGCEDIHAFLQSQAQQTTPKIEL